MYTHMCVYTHTHTYTHARLLLYAIHSGDCRIECEYSTRILPRPLPSYEAATSARRRRTALM